MISTSGKPQFILKYESYIDEDKVAHCKLTGIGPRQTQTNPETGTHIVEMICAGVISLYLAHGWPEATARPKNMSTFSREFGLKLAKKKLFRKVFNDLCRYSGKDFTDGRLKTVRQEIALYYYMNGVRLRLGESIDNMNMTAAILEGERTAKPTYKRKYGCITGHKESVDAMLDAIDNYLADKTSDKDILVKPSVETVFLDTTDIEGC